MQSHCGRTKYIWWDVNLCFKGESQITEVKICNSVSKRTGGTVNLPAQDLIPCSVSLTYLPCLSQYKVLAQLTQVPDRGKILWVRMKGELHSLVFKMFQTVFFSEHPSLFLQLYTLFPISTLFLKIFGCHFQQVFCCNSMVCFSYS